MKAYSKYKNSGIPSLGLIPETWQISRMKYVADLFTGNSLNDSQKEQYSQICEDSYPYVATKDVTFGNEPANYNNGVWIPKGEPRFKLAPKDSFLLCVEGGSAGRKMTYLDRDVCFVNKLCCFVSRLNPKFHYYYIQSQSFGSIFKQSLQGLIGGVSISDLEKFPIVVPPLAEQEAIAVYLDEKTAKIDECVKLLEYQKTDLLKFRTAIISEVVKHGLNRDAVLKESGVSWLGQIPDNWDVIPMKYCMNIRNGQDYKKYSADSGYPVFGSGGPFAFSSEYMYDGEVVFYGRKGTIDKPLYYKGKFWAVDTMFYAIPKDNIIGKFLYYASIIIPFEYYSTSTALPSMTQSDLNNNPMALPPIEEQQKIVNHLDSKTAKIDEAIQRIDEQINDLRAYRTALISEVVTGKIDVRNN